MIVVILGMGDTLFTLKYICMRQETTRYQNIIFRRFISSRLPRIDIQNQSIKSKEK